MNGILHIGSKMIYIELNDLDVDFLANLFTDKKTGLIPAWVEFLLNIIYLPAKD